MAALAPLVPASVRRFPVSAAYFGMVLSIVGMGSAWQLAAKPWALPAFVGETLMALAGLVGLGLTLVPRGRPGRGGRSYPVLLHQPLSGNDHAHGRGRAAVLPAPAPAGAGPRKERHP